MKPQTAWALALMAAFEMWPFPLQGQAGAPVADADCLRLARHSAARARVLRALLQRLATIPETVELARATGLTLGNILYNAQMIRTWSLLLRNAQRRGWVGASRLLLGAAHPGGCICCLSRSFWHGL